MERLAALLYSAGLVSKHGGWLGGSSQLLFVGDFFDRGPYGIEAVDFVMGLQQEAQIQGGWVEALLGNHDLLTLGTIKFKGTFLINHQRNGGSTHDLRRVTSTHTTWLLARPAVLRLGTLLITHADTNRYLKYGRTLTQVNKRIGDILANPNETMWHELL